MLEPLPNAGDLEHLLLLGQLERHLRGDGIGQTPRRIDSRQRGQNLRRNLLVELDVLLEARHHGASQDVHLAAILLTAFGQLLGFRGEAVRHDQVAQARSSDALHENLDRAVRQLQELQDRCQRADLVDVLRPRLVDIGLCLGDEQDLAIASHRLIQRGDRPFAADEQRNHRVRIHDNVAQRQNREAADSRSFGAICHGFRSRESGASNGRPERRRAGASDVRLHGGGLVCLVDDVRLGLARHHGIVHHDLRGVRHRRQVVHRFEQHVLENGSKAAGAGLALHRLARHCADASSRN